MDINKYIELQDLNDYGVPNLDDEDVLKDVPQAISRATIDINSLSANQIDLIGITNLSTIQQYKVKLATTIRASWYLSNGLDLVRGSASVNVGTINASSSNPDDPNYIDPAIITLLQEADLYKVNQQTGLDNCNDYSRFALDPRNINFQTDFLTLMNWFVHRNFNNQPGLISSDNSIIITIPANGTEPIDLQAVGGGGGISPTPDNIYPINKDMLIAGTNITLTKDDTNKTITISSTSNPTKDNIYPLLKDIIQNGYRINMTEDDANQTITLSFKDIIGATSISDIGVSHTPQPGEIVNSVWTLIAYSGSDSVDVLTNRLRIRMTYDGLELPTNFYVNNDGSFSSSGVARDEWEIIIDGSKSVLLVECEVINNEIKMIIDAIGQPFDLTKLVIDEIQVIGYALSASVFRNLELQVQNNENSINNLSVNDPIFVASTEQEELRPTETSGKTATFDLPLTDPDGDTIVYLNKPLIIQYRLKAQPQAPDQNDLLSEWRVPIFSHRISEQMYEGLFMRYDEVELITDDTNKTFQVVVNQSSIFDDPQRISIVRLYQGSTVAQAPVIGANIKLDNVRNADQPNTMFRLDNQGNIVFDSKDKYLFNDQQTLQSQQRPVQNGEFVLLEGLPSELANKVDLNTTDANKFNKIVGYDAQGQGTVYDLPSGSGGKDLNISPDPNILVELDKTNANVNLLKFDGLLDFHDSMRSFEIETTANNIKYDEELGLTDENIPPLTNILDPTGANPNIFEFALTDETQQYEGQTMQPVISNASTGLLVPFVLAGDGITPVQYTSTIGFSTQLINLNNPADTWTLTVSNVSGVKTLGLTKNGLTINSGLQITFRGVKGSGPTLKEKVETNTSDITLNENRFINYLESIFQIRIQSGVSLPATPGAVQPNGDVIFDIHVANNAPDLTNDTEYWFEFATNEINSKKEYVIFRQDKDGNKTFYQIDNQGVRFSLDIANKQITMTFYTGNNDIFLYNVKARDVKYHYEEIKSTLVAGTNVSITPDDTGKTLTFEASGSGGTPPSVDNVYPINKPMFVGSSSITITPDDTGKTLTLTSPLATANQTNLANLENDVYANTDAITDLNEDVSDSVTQIVNNRDSVDNIINTFGSIVHDKNATTIPSTPNPIDKTYTFSLTPISNGDFTTNGTKHVFDIEIEDITDPQSEPKIVSISSEVGKTIPNIIDSNSLNTDIVNNNQLVLTFEDAIVITNIINIVRCVQKDASSTPTTPKEWVQIATEADFTLISGNTALRMDNISNLTGKDLKVHFYLNGGQLGELNEYIFYNDSIDTPSSYGNTIIKKNGSEFISGNIQFYITQFAEVKLPIQNLNDGSVNNSTDVQNMAIKIYGWQEPTPSNK